MKTKFLLSTAIIATAFAGAAIAQQAPKPEAPKKRGAMYLVPRCAAIAGNYARSHDSPITSIASIFRLIRR
jgi:hypothetical protein